jgi:hypothetical protein
MKHMSKRIISALAEPEKTSTGTTLRFKRRAWSAILALAAFGYTDPRLANAIGTPSSPRSAAHDASLRVR